jgi:hypothetical protein
MPTDQIQFWIDEMIRMKRFNFQNLETKEFERNLNLIHKAFVGNPDNMFVITTRDDKGKEQFSYGKI